VYAEALLGFETTQNSNKMK